jgi:hypothetical protein
MKKSTRNILWGVLLALVSINAVLLLKATRPPVRLEMEMFDRYPAKRVQFANDTGRAMNFFFFTEVRSNGTWVSASPQPKGARAANFVKPHSIREFEIAPAPDQKTAWRVGFTYQAAVAPWYLEWPNQFGMWKDRRTRYVSNKKTSYMEFNKSTP